MDKNVEEQGLYLKQGYESRSEYLKSLANKYGATRELVNNLAFLLGVEEDFTGLIFLLNDFQKYFNTDEE